VGAVFPASTVESALFSAGAGKTAPTREGLRQFSRATIRRPIRRASRLVLGEEVGQAGDPRVHLRAAERFVVGLLAGRHLHERRAAEEHLGLLLHHHV
jgi:hypothetical protein